MYEGYSNAHLAALDNGGPSVQSTCGVMERKDVACWESSHPTEYERTRPTAKIFMSGSVCTAWRVGPDNRVFTNNHCVASQSGVANTELWFNYQRTSCNGSQNAAVTKVSGQTMLSTNYDLDYTLLTVNDFASIEGFSYYGLDVRPPVLGERIYISQHGAGNPKELAIESDANSNNLCQVDVALRDGLGDDTDMGYKCDTTGGSSGSPVLAASTNKVIALHHLGGCPSGTNAGVHINQIWPRVSSYFDGIPGNPPTLPPTGNPVASFTFSANELNVTFNNASSDANGSIASNLWDFGDGTTSNTANPTHTYANTGDYNVTLTVTDNEGNTNTVSKTVSVTKVDPVTGLQNGVPVTGLSGSDKEFTYFTAQVPDEATQVTFRISGGTGDADLYTRKGLKPTLSDYDCRPYVGGNNESCVDSNVSEGVYHVGVQAYSDFSNLTLEYTYSSTPNDVYSGSLSGRNDSEIEPDDGQIEVTGSATISAKLTGPQNADFDLEMQQFINGSWKRIDVSQSSSSTENITKTVSSGQYRFKVYSYNGSGNYTLTIEQ
jgi:PKD repeat protein